MSTDLNLELDINKYIPIFELVEQLNDSKNNGEAISLPKVRPEIF
jgi:hypothetical protein